MQISDPKKKIVHKQSLLKGREWRGKAGARQGARIWLAGAGGCCVNCDVLYK